MEHMIIDIVATRPEGDIIHVDMTKVTQACLPCRSSDLDERPTTPCPLDEAHRTVQLGQLAAAMRSVVERGEEQPEPVWDELLGWAVGDYVSWGPNGRATTVRITGTGSRYGRSFSYESWDGYLNGVDDSIFMSLERKVANWRRATEEERETFDRLYRPAPQNWN